jgi:hypothetical protein
MLKKIQLKHVTIRLSLYGRIIYKIEYTVSLPLENHFSIY